MLLASAPARATPAPCEAAALKAAAVGASPSANTHVLADSNGFNPDYGKIAADLKPGDVIVFPHQKAFRVHGIIGQGMMTRIVDIGDGLALRMPRSSSTEAQAAMREFAEQHPQLKRSGVDVVDADIANSQPPYFIIVKKENIAMTLEDYNNGKDESGKAIDLTPAQKKAMDAALIKFAEGTWLWRSIGDFAARQVAWNGERWILLDFRWQAAMIGDFNVAYNTFDPRDGWDSYGHQIQINAAPALYKKITAAITAERARQAKTAHVLFRFPGSGDARRHFVSLKGGFAEDLVGSKIELTKFDLSWKSPIMSDTSIEECCTPKTSSQRGDLPLTVQSMIGQEGGYYKYKVLLADGRTATLYTYGRSTSVPHSEMVKSKLDSSPTTGPGELLHFGEDYFLIAD